MGKNIILTEGQFRDYVNNEIAKRRNNPEQSDKDIANGNMALDNMRFAVEENEDFSQFGLEPDPKQKKAEIDQSWNEFNKMNREPVEKVTPERITSLKPNEIFVFGSNLKGLHAGGAARCALDNFGAQWGNGVGIQGQSYAIPTLTAPGGYGADMLSIPELKKYIDEFLNFAAQHRDLVFLVTPIGCGIAGFTPEEIAPLFKPALDMNNVTLPQSFLDVLQPDTEDLGGLINEIENA